MESALALVEQFPIVEMFRPGAMDDILGRIEVEVRAHKPDISTEKGRAAVKSLAYKVARSRTFIEDRRKELVSDEKKRLAAIDAEGKKLRERLESLQEEARKPLTEWETTEKERCARHESNIEAMMLVGTLDFGASVETIQERIVAIRAVDVSTFQEFVLRATETRDSVLSGLETKLKIAEKQEADRIEMDRLRKEAEERARKDRDEEIARQAREAEQRRQETERQRIEQEKFAAEARAKQAEAAKAEAERRHVVELNAAAERQKREAQEAEQLAERRRQQAIEDERRRVATEQARVAAEQKQRERDRAHKATVNKAALAAFVAAGISDACGKQVITEIAKGKIPNVKISY